MNASLGEFLAYLATHPPPPWIEWLAWLFALGMLSYRLSGFIHAERFTRDVYGSISLEERLITLTLRARGDRGLSFIFGVAFALPLVVAVVYLAVDTRSRWLMPVAAYQAGVWFVGFPLYSLVPRWILLLGQSNEASRQLADELTRRSRPGAHHDFLDIEDEDELLVESNLRLAGKVDWLESVEVLACRIPVILVDVRSSGGALERELELLLRLGWERKSIFVVDDSEQIKVPELDVLRRRQPARFVTLEGLYEILDAMIADPMAARSKLSALGGGIVYAQPASKTSVVPASSSPSNGSGRLVCPSCACFVCDGSADCSACGAARPVDGWGSDS